MKKRKIEKSYLYNGFGFPILLEDVPMVEIRGTWTPEVNYNILQKVVLLALCYQSNALTGNQVRFIRKYFEMTLDKFAKKFDVTHAAVLKWEKKDDNPAKILQGYEKEIRLFVLDQILSDAKEFRLAFRKIFEQSYTLSKCIPLQVDVPLELSLRTG